MSLLDLQSYFLRRWNWGGREGSKHLLGKYLKPYSRMWKVLLTTHTNRSSGSPPSWSTAICPWTALFFSVSRRAHAASTRCVNSGRYFCLIPRDDSFPISFRHVRTRSPTPGTFAVMPVVHRKSAISNDEAWMVKTWSCLHFP